MYGGTKEEMERLIKHANELKEAQGELGDLSIDSYADIVDAIHLVQEEMGVTGTTAKEASTTIQGSVNSMKSAWANLVTGLADDNADMGKLIDNLLETILGSVDETGERIGGVINNIMPRVETALSGIGALIEGLAPIIGEVLPSLIETLLPSLIEATTSLISSFTEALPSLLTTVSSALASGITTIMTDAVPDLLLAIPDIFSAVVTAVGSAVSDFDAADVEDFTANLTYQLGLKVSELATNVASVLPQLAELASGIIKGIATGIRDLSADGTISETILTLLNTATDLVVIGLDTLESLLEIAPEIINGIVEGLNSEDLDFDAIAEGISDVIIAGANAIAEIDWDAMIELAGKVIDAITKAIGEIDVSELGDAIYKFIGNGGLKALGLVTGLVVLKNIGKNVIKQVVSGLTTGFSTSTVGSIITALLGKGISKGAEDASGEATKAGGTIAKKIASGVSTGLNAALPTLGVASFFVALAAIIGAQGDEIHDTVEGMLTDVERVQQVNQALQEGTAIQKEVQEAQASFTTNTANDVWAILNAYENLSDVNDETWSAIISQITLAGETGSQQFGYLQSTLSDLGLEFDLTSGTITDMSGNIVASLEQFGYSYDEASQSIVDSSGNIVATLTEEGEVAVATAEKISTVTTAIDEQTAARSKAILAENEHSASITQLAQQYHISYDEAVQLAAVMNSSTDTTKNLTTAIDEQTAARSKAILSESEHSTSISQLAQQYHISYDEAVKLAEIMSTPPDTSGTVEAMNSVGSSAESNTSSATTAFQNMTADELAEMDTLITELPGKSNDALTSMFNQYTFWAPSLKQGMGDITDSILDKVKLLASRMSVWGETVVKNLNTAIRGQAQASYSAGYAVMLKARNGAEAISLYSTGVNAGLGLVNGLSSMYYSVYSAAYSLGLAAKRAANSALGIASPSKVFKEIGEYTDEGLIEGLVSGYSDVEKASSDLANLVTFDTNSNVSYSGTSNVSTPAWANELITQLTNLKIYLDGKTLVGGTIGYINDEMGNMNTLNKRGSAYA